MRISTLQRQLLGWYDVNRRVMPWRAAKGHQSNPYHVWLSEIMLQQTTVAAVVPYFLKFTEKWPTVQNLAEARLDDVLAAWAGLGYYARARNLHQCAQGIVYQYKSAFPTTVAALQALPGIGAYTAAAIASIAFDRQAVAVDGNVERVVSRFFAIQDPLPRSKTILRIKAEELADDNAKPSDFTQAFMELGATVCTPKRPKCGICPWRAACVGRKLGIAEELPRKSPKKTKPLRYGQVFWISRKDGGFYIHKRTGKGLYAGLYQLPTTEWGEDKMAFSKPCPPFEKQLNFVRYGEAVGHSFTHFDLVLEIWKAKSTVAKLMPAGLWASAADMDTYALPSLMKKVIRLCLDDQQGYVEKSVI